MRFDGGVLDFYAFMTGGISVVMDVVIRDSLLEDVGTIAPYNSCAVGVDQTGEFGRTGHNIRGPNLEAGREIKLCGVTKKVVGVIKGEQ